MSTKESILTKIADYLARRDHSILEIQEKLAQKKIYDPEDVDAALQNAIAQKWFLPEGELAEKVARALNSKNKSHFFILNYLQAKGLPPVPFIEEHELKAMERCLQKKFKNFTNLNITDKQKALRMLASRGFKPELCYKIVDQTFEDF